MPARPTCWFDYVLDFAAANDYSAWLANGYDQRIIVKIEGHSWYSKTVRSQTTGRVVHNISNGNIDTYIARGGDVERLRSAFAHFRTAFCKRSAQGPDDDRLDRGRCFLAALHESAIGTNSAFAALHESVSCERQMRRAPH